MYAIGEMHQVISETYTLIWAAKQKDFYPIIKKKIVNIHVKVSWSGVVVYFSLSIGWYYIFVYITHLFEVPIEFVWREKIKIIDLLFFQTL